MSWWWLVVAFALGWFWHRGYVTTSPDDEWAGIVRRRQAYVDRGHELARERERLRAKYGWRR